MKAPRITVSWSILFICILQVIVWSFGVSESHAKDFYVREQGNLKSFCTPIYDRYRLFEKLQIEQSIYISSTLLKQALLPSLLEQKTPDKHQNTTPKRRAALHHLLAFTQTLDQADTDEPADHSTLFFDLSLIL